MTTQGSSAPPRKGSRTRIRILQAALELFSDHGFTGTSVRDIAARAGLSHAGLLHHFTNKDELLVEALAFREARDEEHAEAFAPWGIDQLFAWTVDIVRANSADPARVALFVQLSAEASRPSHPGRDYFERRYERVLTALEGAFAAHFLATPPHDDVAPRDAAITLVALLDGLQVQWLLRPHETDMTRIVRAHLASLGILVPEDLPEKEKP